MQERDSYNQRINNALALPSRTRRQLVADIQSTIPLERIRGFTYGNVQAEIWGIVWVEGLPFRFRAHEGIDRQVPFSGDKTKLWPHAIYKPDEFVSPRPEDPKGKEDDMVYMLKGIQNQERTTNKFKRFLRWAVTCKGADDIEIEYARAKGELGSLLKSTIDQRTDRYKEILESYNGNDLSLRMASGAAIIRACDGIPVDMPEPEPIERKTLAELLKENKYARRLGNFLIGKEFSNGLNVAAGVGGMSYLLWRASEDLGGPIEAAKVIGAGGFGVASFAVLVSTLIHTYYKNRNK